MLKIFIVYGPEQRRLVLKGQLIAPWVEELRTAWSTARENFEGELVIDMAKVLVVSQEGENALLQMMNDGASFRSSGVLTRHVLQQLQRRRATPGLWMARKSKTP